MVQGTSALSKRLADNVAVAPGRLSVGNCPLSAVRRQRARAACRRNTGHRPRPTVGGEGGGSVLILVLIVLSSMTALSVGLAYRTRIELKLAEANAKRVQAYYLALGGIERVKARLAATELSAKTIPALCTFGATAAQENLFEQVPEFGAIGAEPASPVSLQYDVHDELGYFNINHSDPAAWAHLGFLGREQLSAIVDWIDEDDDAGPGGAESDFYARLSVPYAAKNGPCASLRELLCVRGIDRRLYLGGSGSDERLPETRAGTERSPVQAKAGESARVGLLDVFTVYGNGKININTAAPAVLAALPGLDETAIETIAAWQGGPDGQPGTDDDGIAATAADLAKIEGLTEQQIELLTEYACFDSRFFRVFSRAQWGPRFHCCLMATLGSGPDGPQEFYVERLW
jgi:type II secretory pathway component PulK